MIYAIHIFEKLTNELKTLNDLHQLLTVLPQLKFIDVAINHRSTKFPEDMQYISILTIRYFRLRSSAHNWNLDELRLILKRIPNVQKLIIQINIATDTRLTMDNKYFLIYHPYL